MSIPDANDTTYLAEFGGRTAQIVQLNLPAAEEHRLKSLGLFEGQSIEVQKTETGSPLILTAAGSRVAIAHEIAARILVRPSDNRAAWSLSN